MTNKLVLECVSMTQRQLITYSVFMIKHSQHSMCIERDKGTFIFILVFFVCLLLINSTILEKHSIYIYFKCFKLFKCSYQVFPCARSIIYDYFGVNNKLREKILAFKIKSDFYNL